MCRRAWKGENENLHSGERQGNWPATELQGLGSVARRPFGWQSVQLLWEHRPLSSLPPGANPGAQPLGTGRLCLVLLPNKKKKEEEKGTAHPPRAKSGSGQVTPEIGSTSSEALVPFFWPRLSFRVWAQAPSLCRDTHVLTQPGVRHRQWLPGGR